MSDKFAIHYAQDLVEELLAGQIVDNLRLQELLYLLDNLMLLHNFLDLHDIPCVNAQGMDMSLQERISCLFSMPRATAELKRDFYDKPLPLNPKQLQFC